jgi:aminoglycoside 6-adenylyltransferase
VRPAGASICPVVYRYYVTCITRISRYPQNLLHQKPSEEDYKRLVNEFWWDVTYVAKNLWREEIFPAKYSSDYVIRYKILLKMLEWYVQIDRGWKCRTGFVGKGVKKMLSESEWNELKGIFAGAGIEDNRQALFNTIEFFRKISMAVANDIGYKYPDELDRNISDYIEGICAKKVV